MTTAIAITGGLFMVYWLAVLTWSVTSKRYYSATGAVQHYNDLSHSGARTINKCGECGYLFSNYFLHENNRVTCGCPRCGSDRWKRTGAYPVIASGSAYLFNEKIEWREIKK